MPIRRELPLWLLLALAASLLLSSYSIWKRHRAEVANKSTSIAVEFDAAEFLAAGEGIPVETALANLKLQGVNAVTLNEETVGELISEGRAAIVMRVRQAAFDRGRRATITEQVLELRDPTQIQRVQRGLKNRFGGLIGIPDVRSNQIVLPDVSATLVRSTSIGLNPGQAKAAEDLRLTIIARMGNSPGLNAEAVKETLRWANEMGAKVFLPLGDQVLGRRDALEATETTLGELGMRYASPEFGKIGGDQNMVDKMPDNVIRLHTAQMAEMDKLTLDDAVERYVKAARERNMRILLLRPLSLSADRPVEAFALFVKQVHDELKREGLTIGPAKPFVDPDVPRWVFPLLGLSLAGVLPFAAIALGMGKRWETAALAVGILLAMLSAVKTGQQLSALAASLAFPLVGFGMLDRLRPKSPIVGLLLVSVVSLLGGMFVAGMLNGLPYLVKADEFRGIKLSVFLPVLLVGGLFFVRLTDWKAGLASPITWGASGLAIVILGVLLLMVARSGNDTGAGASGLELQFRGLLDAVLYVRPRTKEFMIGHPALLVGTWMLARYGDQRGGMASWTALVLMVGAIGQTSIVNTLCHLHIPVVLSLARVLIGLVVGAVIGAGVLAVVKRLLPVQPEVARAD